MFVCSCLQCIPSWPAFVPPPLPRGSFLPALPSPLCSSCPTGAGSALVGTWHNLAESLRKEDQLMGRQGGSTANNPVPLISPSSFPSLPLSFPLCQPFCSPSYLPPPPPLPFPFVFPPLSLPFTSHFSPLSLPFTTPSPHVPIPTPSPFPPLPVPLPSPSLPRSLPLPSPPPLITFT
ncbi:unnamed protein product [Closterium sp. Naga37s-1]|nr:unnamed protein product [Closterium sp. Naga37s-1]